MSQNRFQILDYQQYLTYSVLYLVDILNPFNIILKSSFSGTYIEALPGLIDRPLLNVDFS